MATNFAANAAVNELAARRGIEHRFFLTVAILFPIITVIGFAPSYYLKTLFATPPLPSGLVHAHGISMSLWIVLYLVQTYLITSKQIKLHMTLGIFGVVLAAAMIVIGIATGYASAARGAAFPGYSPSEFFIVPIGDMLVFAALFGAAIYYRKNAANHKRLMLVTVLNFLPPSIGRLPLAFIPDLGAWWFWGVPAVIAVLFLLVDTWRNERFNRVFAAAIALLILSGPVRLFIARTEAWTQFAGWILG